jgi:hypothetical protein
MDFRPFYEQDFAEAREVLAGVIDENASRIAIYTDFMQTPLISEDVELAGLYIYSSRKIVLYNGWAAANNSILHEYIHFLTRDIKQAPMLEGLTEAVAILKCENRTRRTQMASEVIADEILFEQLNKTRVWDSEKAYPNLRRLNTLLSLSFYDRYTQNYKTITQEKKKNVPKELTINDLSYDVAASIAEYMFELYGIETVYACVSDYDKMEALWGKPFSEFYEDWHEWLLQRFIEDGGIVENAA